MLSIVCNAHLEGEDPPELTDQELQFFFSLLWAAGADTTRNAIAGAIVALDAFPDEWRALRDAGEVSSAAVEEIVRWTHPAAYNRRTATRDLELFGETVRAGDKVVFWEASANRDEDVFADPFRFDLARDPNPHLGFGHGVHHCLGANLARLEIRVVLDELCARVRRRSSSRVRWSGRGATSTPASATCPVRLTSGRGRRRLGLRRDRLACFGLDRRRVELRERDHAFVDVVHALAVERAGRPRSPEVPPRLHLAAEAERQRAAAGGSCPCSRRRGTSGST